MLVVRRWWDKDCEHMLHSEKQASGDHPSPLMSRIPNDSSWLDFLPCTQTLLFETRKAENRRKKRTDNECPTNFMMASNSPRFITLKPEAFVLFGIAGIL
ncbi:hypothetical protein OIU85_024454 [Salix viminalis]|uniref:Uncharacterized protein n=1 Tax=Salix viminalis TaxID=40686 RepID=A0A9Q0Z4T6_SALVM|nr:hypothetical protein OIU85_024454 [Salix viminalis]